MPNQPEPPRLCCPFDAGVAVSDYATWADVPDWWPCTCGAEHRKDMPEPPRPPAQEQIDSALEYAIALMRNRLDVEAPTNAAVIRGYIAALTAAPRPPEQWCAACAAGDHVQCLGGRCECIHAEARPPAPTIACPACGEQVRQVSSATLDLALWQHWNWVCSKRAEARPPAPDNEQIALRRLSDALTGGNAATWDEIFHAAEARPPAPAQEPTYSYDDPPHMREDYRDVWRSGYRAGAKAEARPPAPDALRELAGRIARWREDDKGGYDQAIELLCVAEALLSAGGASATPKQLEDDTRVDGERLSEGQDLPRRNEGDA